MLARIRVPVRPSHVDVRVLLPFLYRKVWTIPLRFTIISTLVLSVPSPSPLSPQSLGTDLTSIYGNINLRAVVHSVGFWGVLLIINITYRIL